MKLPCFLIIERFPTHTKKLPVGDPGSVPGSGRSPGEGNGYTLHFLAWRIPWTEQSGGLQVHGVAKSQTQQSTNTFTFTIFTGIVNVGRRKQDMDTMTLGIKLRRAFSH